MSSSSSSTTKTQTGETQTGETLIPGLLNDLSTQILSSLPLPHQSHLLPISKPIHSLLSSPFPFLLRRLLRLHSHHLVLFPSDPFLTPPLLLDPITLLWAPLPPLPVSPYLFSLSNFTPVFLFPYLYILGGSHFDARSYPLNHPLPSSAAFKLDLTDLKGSSSWVRVESMRVPRGSFACAADEITNSIIVAGGGSRHEMYPMEGSRIRNVEVYDVEIGEWEVKKGMRRSRAGCVGFVRKGEFWVMGGYGEYRVMGGVVPRDVYCRDAVVMEMGTGEWREVGDMWEDGERRRLGKLGIIEVDGEVYVFMLDRNDIFRYVLQLNNFDS